MRLATGTLVAGALLVAPAAVQAAPGNDTFIEATEFGALGQSAAGKHATCPGGSRVVGGGVHTTGPPPSAGQPGYRVQLSGPLDGSGLTANTDTGDVARHWYAYVFNQRAEMTMFRVFALCSRTSDAVVEATTTDPTRGSGVRSVACPAGRRALSGGMGTTAAAPDYPALRFGLAVSGPVDETRETANTVTGDVARAWRTGFANYTGVAATFKTFALCSATSDATIEAADVLVPANGPGAGSAICPSASRLVGGGMNVVEYERNEADVFSLMLNGPLDQSGTAAGTEDGDVPRSWSAIVHNPVGEYPFKAFAVCAPEDPQGAEGGGGPGGGGPGGGGPGGGGPGGGKAYRCDGKLATIVGTNRGETLRGTRRSDVIVALGGNDRVLAGRGNDLVCGGSGKDRIDGAAGNDKLLGGDGKDTLLGAAGKDALLGGAGKDALTGGPGADRQRQ